MQCIHTIKFLEPDYEDILELVHLLPYPLVILGDLNAYSGGDVTTAKTMK